MKFFRAIFLLWPFAVMNLDAQTPPETPPRGLAQLQVQQAPVDTSSAATATAAFDPPTAQIGEKVFYRVTVSTAASSVHWPEQIPASTGLQLVPRARGQLNGYQGNKYLPLTSFLYEAQPATTGHFSISSFVVEANGKPLEIPTANLDVVAETPNPQPARQLVLETSATNVFLGEPFHVRVMLPVDPGDQAEAVREIQLNGDGLIVDRTTQLSIAPVNVGGEVKPAFICEMKVTPIASGPLKFSAQGFTAGREFTGPISIQGQVIIPAGPPNYVLLISDAAEINVRPLPIEGELPGYTGSMGIFSSDQPQLSANRLHVGEPVQLRTMFRAQSDLTRFVPPEPPRSRDWQIIADEPPGSGFTLIPLTDEATNTPPVPFCYFNPATAKYVDLTVPPLPVTVVGDSLPVQVSAFDDETKSTTPLKLSGLATTPGKTVTNLEPPQLRGWLVGAQLAPVLGLIALWQWDRRRRFFEAHPEIARRRRARRELRREQRQLRKAVAAGDSENFLRHAVAALRAACAPHFPAQPQALVCGNVLAQIVGATERERETVRQLFAAADAQFAAKSQAHGDLLVLNPGLDAVLEKLEAKL